MHQFRAHLLHFFDLHKTLDTIDRKKILPERSKMYSLRGPLYTVIELYLKDWEQFVQSGQSNLQMTDVKIEVPQGFL